MQQLIGDLFLKAFDNPILRQGHDAAVLNIPAQKIAFTTDSYVIHPLIFPGGDIGSLAIHGTVNDLAMSGAKPLYISVGFIIEEGLKMEDLWSIACSMRKAADACGVEIATGDTKVVDQGKGDGVFINTAGIGVIEHDLNISASSIRAGDKVIVSGDIGRHGIAIMAVRSGLEFGTTIESDSAPVSHQALALIDADLQVHCLRDITRGGLASVLNELATSAGVSIEIDELSIPVREDVSAACELLGFDPLYVACEGRFVSFIAKEDCKEALEILGTEARVVGTVTTGSTPPVVMKSRIGSKRVVSLLSGEQLPRIC
jgi:hydrogenase expression/formation protein HypE